jgi:ABC-type lipoprotein export system ATPase subunit
MGKQRKSTVKGFGKSMLLSLTNLLSQTCYQDVCYRKNEVSSSLVKEKQQKMANRFGRVGAKPVLHWAAI